MKGHLKEMRITLICDSPVHVGQGVAVGKKEYILDRAKNELYYPDLVQMSKILASKNKLEQYEGFMLGRPGQPGDLHAFFRQNQIGRGEWWGGPISLHGSPAAIKQPIQTFIKDAYGMPYLPGSSIKGAFRTIMLSEETRAERKGGPSAHPRPKAEEIENNICNILKRSGTKAKDAVNDVFQAFRFGDSTPIARDALIVCQKIDRPAIKARDPKGDRSLPLFRECLKPGTRIEAMLTVNKSLLDATPYKDMFEFKTDERKDGSTLRMLTFLELLRNYNAVYTNEYRQHFVTGHNQANTLYLGAGTGFITKTMWLGTHGERERLPEIARLLKRQFSKGGHRKDENIGVSPHMLKMTKYNGKIYEMGKCSLEIEEI